MRGAGVGIVIAVAVAMAAGVRAQDAADSPEYTAVIDSAVAEFGAGHWPEARALFERAHAMAPNARTLRGIGMASFEMRDYPEAVRALDGALASTVRPLTEEQRAHASELLGRARALTGRFVIPAAPEGARIYVDGAGVDPGRGWPAGEGVIVLAVGPHTIAIRTASGRSTDARVTVRGSEDTRLDVDVALLAPPSEDRPPVEMDRSPLPPPSGPPASGGQEADPSTVPWVVVGTGGGALAIGAAFFGFGLSEIAAVEDSAAGTEWADVEEAGTRGAVLTTVGVVVMILGAATAGTGLVLLATSGSRDEESDSARLELRLGPGSLALGGSFR